MAATEMHVWATCPDAQLHLARKHRISWSSGETFLLGRRAARVMVWMACRAYPNLEVTIECAYRDPADEDVLWTRKHTAGTSRDGAVEHNHIVAWHRVREDRIVASWEFMPIEPHSAFAVEVVPAPATSSPSVR